MRIGGLKFPQRYLGIAVLLACGLAQAADTPANVAGTWKIALTGATGNAEQTIVLTQDAGKITGTFKGPRQSGPLQGTVDGNNIAFHTSTRVPLDYKGVVDGSTMKGTMMGNGKTADWTATRAN